jgi:hypothetical protein
MESLVHHGVVVIPTIVVMQIFRYLDVKTLLLLQLVNGGGFFAEDLVA